MKKETLILRLEAIISLHTSMSKCYFFTSPSTAAQRRIYEEHHSMTTEFIYGEDTIRVRQTTKCSCSYVYYSVVYYINGECVSKDIRFIKKILKELKEQ